jgi:hypothetical protein
MSVKKAYVNIKNLPETLQVTDGDFLLVEREDGTYILDYANFLLETEKTVITTLVYANQTDIETLSSSVNEQILALSAQIDANTTKVYIGKATVTIDNGTSNSAFLSPRPSSDVPDITPDDFIVTPANSVAGRFGGYISEVVDSSDGRGFFTVTAGFYRTTMTADISTGEVTVITTDSTAEELGAQPSYNVLVYKTY